IVAWQISLRISSPSDALKAAVSADPGDDRLSSGRVGTAVEGSIPNLHVAFRLGQPLFGAV
ncbi:hypothetical protein, partial [Neorhizobium galegae]|uniref:hypothetical protein n=1 Tax=Neorhizobium galegae TaxID=399 RepID=UPI001AEF2543